MRFPFFPECSNDWAVSVLRSCQVLFQMRYFGRDFVMLTVYATSMQDTAHYETLHEQVESTSSWNVQI